MKWFSSTIFSIFRILFGSYLFVHYVQLLPVCEEVFSNQGVIKNAQILPSYNILPLHIFKYDDPMDIRYFVISLIIGSGLFTLGIMRRIVSLWLFYGWMCLVNRNPLISNPGIGYIGWLLLACALIPPGERLGFLQNEAERKAYFKKYGRWEVPDIIYFGTWIIIGISYTASGVHKLQCESWLNGTALRYVLTGPLAYQNNLIVQIILSNDYLVKAMTYGSLFLELSALFLGTFNRLRPGYWLMFMGFHIGILLTVNFADLTLGMMIPHLFTFDASWCNLTRHFVEKYDWANTPLIEYDINHTDDFNTSRMRDNFKKVLNEMSESSKKLIKSSKEKVINSSSHQIALSSWIIYIVLLMLICIVILSKGSITDSINRLMELTLDMYWGFGFITVTLGFLMILERQYPDQELKHVDGWWKWVIIINIFQLFAVILASFTWEKMLQETNYFKSNLGFHLRDHVSPFVGGLIAYFVAQWLFYYWHRARHEVYFLWILFHQFHHSPSRIETITSFYKHPLEIIADSQILAIILYSVLGLSNESSIWLSIFSAIGEYVYHMNIKTPKIMGYFFQRPESHRVHHHGTRLFCPNFSDISLFDILGRTFENPETMNERTGFSSETRRIDMLMFKDVITAQHQDIFSDLSKFKKVVVRYLSYGLVIYGCLNSSSFIAHSDSFREMGFATVSSPLPLVFSSYNGIETFSTAFTVNITFKNGTTYGTDLDANMYNMIGGAYNRRNVYGAVFSHGPFFDKENIIKIRQEILSYAVCDPGIIVKEFNIPGDIKSLRVNVLYRPQNNKKISELLIDCS